MFVSGVLGEEVGIDVLKEHAGSWRFGEFNHNVTWVEVGVDKVVQ
jgi:hypothetical protein